jgi:hypothetical protein
VSTAAGEPLPQEIRQAAAAAQEQLQSYLDGNWMARHLVYVCAKLGLADLLRDGPRPSQELAAAAGAHAPTLHRVLRGMVAFRLVTETEDGRFALDEAGQLLRSDAPHGLRGRVIKERELELAWGGLLHTVRTGGPAFEHVFGEPPFAHFARDPATHPHLNPGTTWEVAQAIAAAYDFGASQTVADVGGGDGIVLAAILRRNRHLRGTVLDYPHQMEPARRVAARYGVADRFRFAAGDFFQGVPEADVYVLKTILHDWDDPQATRILQRCREAMSERGRVLVVETLLPERAVGASHRFDLVMMVETGGRERTGAEYGALFEAAGLRLSGIRPLYAGRYAGRSLIEGDAGRALVEGMAPGAAPPGGH